MAIELFANSASTSLNGAINNSTTTVVVTDASTFPATGNFRILIDAEIFKVTNVSSNTFTVATRPQEGTSAASHSNGAVVTQILTKAAVNQITADDIVRDTYANIPTAGKQGRLFVPTDGYGLFHDNGSNFLNFTPWGTQMFPPDNSPFSWVNQLSSTITQVGSGLLLQVPGQGSFQVTCRVKTLAASSNYTASFCIMPIMEQAANPDFGVCLRDSVSGKIIQFGCGSTNYGFFVNYLTNATTYSSTPGSVIGAYSGNPIWIRIVDDGSQRRGRFSIDGINYSEFFHNSRTDFVTPDQVGFYINPNQLHDDGRVILLSFKET